MVPGGAIVSSFDSVRVFDSINSADFSIGAPKVFRKSSLDTFLKAQNSNQSVNNTQPHSLM